MMAHVFCLFLSLFFFFCRPNRKDTAMFQPVLRQYLHVKHHRVQQHQFLGNASLELFFPGFSKQIIVDQRSILGESKVFIQILDIPIPSMYLYGIFTFIYGEYTIHGCYGIDILWTQHLYIPCCYRIFWTPHVFFRIFMSRKPSENQWKFLAGDFHFHLSDVFPHKHPWMVYLPTFGWFLW